MNYPILEKDYIKLIDKYFPIDFDEPHPELENELSNLLFKLEWKIKDMDITMGNILWDLKRLNDLKIKNKNLEKQKLNNEVQDIVWTLKNKSK